MKQRDNTILDLLSESGRMEVSLLAEKLGVSQVTIRKDLDALERKGYISRTNTPRSIKVVHPQYQ